MNLTADRISALVFLAVSIAYGIGAGSIELYPGSETEPFTARTFPLILAWAGGLLSFLLLIQPVGAGDPSLFRRDFDWTRVALLCALMLAYGATIKSVGFLVSTTIFLALGFLILGERRWLLIVVVSILVATSFQYILHGLLDIYITDPLLRHFGIIK